MPFLQQQNERPGSMLAKKISPGSEDQGLIKTSIYGIFGETGCIDQETNKIDNSRANFISHRLR